MSVIHVFRQVSAALELLQCRCALIALPGLERHCKRCFAWQQVQEEDLRRILSPGGFVWQLSLPKDDKGVITEPSADP